MTASVVRSLTEFVRVPHFLDPHGGSCHAPAGGAVHAQLQDVLPPEDAGYQMEARMSILLPKPVMAEPHSPRTAMNTYTIQRKITN